METTMTENKSKERTRELTDDELDAVSGGSEPRAFEIKDYGFGVSMPVTTS
jgi:bacteriocin-like protein